MDSSRRGQQPTSTCLRAHQSEQQQGIDAAYRRLWFNDVSARSQQSADARHPSGRTRRAEYKHAPRNAASAPLRQLHTYTTGYTCLTRSSVQGHVTVAPRHVPDNAWSRRGLRLVALHQVHSNGACLHPQWRRGLTSSPEACGLAASPQRYYPWAASNPLGATAQWTAHQLGWAVRPVHAMAR